MINAQKKYEYIVIVLSREILKDAGSAKIIHVKKGVSQIKIGDRQ